MASVEKRAAHYIATTKSAATVPYSHGKSASRTGNPKATVTALNKGILHGPTSSGK